MLRKTLPIVLTVLVVIVGCEKKSAAPEQEPEQKAKALPIKAELLVELPEYCNTPDGMALLPDGSFVLSVPNYNDPDPGAFVMKVGADNSVDR